MDGLHVERNRVVGMNYLGIIDTTSTGIVFVPMAKSYLWPTESLQIVVYLLSVKDVPSIMGELKQFMNFYSMVKTHRMS